MYHAVFISVITDPDIKCALSVRFQRVVVCRRKIIVGYIAQFFCRDFAFECVCCNAVVVEREVLPRAAAVKRILRRNCRLCFDFVAVVVHGIKPMWECNSDVYIFCVRVERVC